MNNSPVKWRRVAELYNRNGYILSRTLGVTPINGSVTKLFMRSWVNWMADVVENGCYIGFYELKRGQYRNASVAIPIDYDPKILKVIRTTTFQHDGCRIEDTSKDGPFIPPEPSPFIPPDHSPEGTQDQS